jgi:hypothetical protein
MTNEMLGNTPLRRSSISETDFMRFVKGAALTGLRRSRVPTPPTPSGHGPPCWSCSPAVGALLGFASPLKQRWGYAWPVLMRSRRLSADLHTAGSSSEAPLGATSDTRLSRERLGLVLGCGCVAGGPLNWRTVAPVPWVAAQSPQRVGARGRGGGEGFKDEVCAGGAELVGVMAGVRGERDPAAVVVVAQAVQQRHVGVQRGDGADDVPCAGQWRVSRRWMSSALPNTAVTPSRVLAVRR